MKATGKSTRIGCTFMFEYQTLTQRSSGGLFEYRGSTVSRYIEIRHAYGKYIIQYHQKITENETYFLKFNMVHYDGVF